MVFIILTEGFDPFWQNEFICPDILNFIPEIVSSYHLSVVCFFCTKSGQAFYFVRLIVPNLSIRMVSHFVNGYFFICNRSSPGTSSGSPRIIPAYKCCFEPIGFEDIPHRPIKIGGILRKPISLPPNCVNTQTVIRSIFFTSNF